MQYLNCKAVSTKIEDAGYIEVGPPGLVSPFQKLTLLDMAARFTALNAEW